MQTRETGALRAFALLFLSASVAAVTPAYAQTASAKKNWTATVNVMADGSHVLGNPAAKVKLEQFVSYTCSHCANFEKQGDAPLRLAYVMPGSVSVRVINILRNPVDVAAATLVNCGTPAGYFKRHQAFMHSQSVWLKKMQDTTAAQRARWAQGDTPSRLRAISSDLGFYELMAPRGFTPVAIDKCLANSTVTEKLVSQTKTASERGVSGTPSFAMNGTLLDGVHDWSALNAALKSKLATHASH